MNLSKIYDPAHTRRKLNVYKTFRRRPRHLLNVVGTFNLHPVCTDGGFFGKNICLYKPFIITAKKANLNLTAFNIKFSSLIY